ncbi:PLP-dependent aminotransferase family protein [Pigmentiphaga aceris]|uniref:PLP-dependent aminotransferase family protein n=1 Tax=Pigmentiphaga aceris TaxID=1940612 RepID=A0A5C0AWN4_9BURK|nr:PLP-dependent aminotransferase family protein [Pigmentiphaga aceris]QEI06728.1 PLP-dependent aminotransferase family protein [Pigmentiphaga aceris]
MSIDLPIAWYAERLQDRTTRGIALETTALIRSGAIPIGTRLPAVRDLAAVLDVSPATISAAWSQLRRFKVISGTGRNGVWVCGDQVSLRPVRFETIGDFGGRIVADLTYATPDPALLPPLADALAAAAKTPDLNSYHRVPITDRLKESALARWPYQPESLLAVNGGFEGVYATLQTLVMPGTVVAIEQPSSLRLLDILDSLGAQVLPVQCDEDGPMPDALRAALRQKASIFLYQPRTHSITATVVSAERMAALADVLQKSTTIVIEDDGVGDISRFPSISLGKWFPERTVHIVSYSKTLGPDLRVAVLSGPEKIVREIRAYRNFGAGWTSRVMQDATAWLLDDPQTGQLVEQARNIYAARRGALVDALQARGMTTAGKDGLCVWVHVPSEQFALVTMAARGIAVYPGSLCSVNNDTQHIRIATSLLTEHVDVVAEALALCQTGRGI